MTVHNDTPEAIQAEHPGYRVWQGKRRSDGQPSDTCWVATLHDPALNANAAVDAGIDPTVISDSPERLRAALAKQRERIEAWTGMRLDL
jgi:hypothetical protein